MKKLASILLVLCLLACDRNDENLPSEVFEVTTMGRSIDCRLVVIEFKESDKERINKFTDWDNRTSFEAYNLDTERFATPGLNLRVRIRKPLDSEFFFCTALGQAYPWVTVLHAEIID